MTEKSFHEILENLLGSSEASGIEAPLKGRVLPKARPFDWTQVHLHHKVTRPRPVKSPYPRRRRKPRPHRTESLQEEIPSTTTQKQFGFHQLNPDGQQAFRSWQRLGSLLSKDALNLEILKIEYRKMAKVCHPDTATGSSARFLEFKSCHSRLEAALRALEEGA